MLFKPITVKAISDYEKKYKGTAKGVSWTKKKVSYVEAPFFMLRTEQSVYIMYIIYNTRIQDMS
jgi:hypothetical protein